MPDVTLHTLAKKTHIIRIFFLESDSGNHDLISQNPLIHILIFLNIQNL